MDDKKCLHCVGTYNTIGECEENTNFHPAVLGTRITTIDSLSEQVTVRLNNWKTPRSHPGWTWSRSLR